MTNDDICDAVSFRFAGMILTIFSEGPAWVLLGDRLQYTDMASAVRAECERLIREMGNDPVNHEAEIQAAIVSAKAGEDEK